MPKSRRPDPVTEAQADPWAAIIAKATAKPLDTLMPGEMTVALMVEQRGVSVKTAGDILLAAEKAGLVTSRRVKLAQDRAKVKAYLPVKHGEK